MENLNYTWILRGFLIAWWLANFIPWQNLLTKYVKPYLIRIPHLNSALSCHKCLAFWVTYAVTMNLYSAIAASICAFIFEKVMNGFKTYL